MKICLSCEGVTTTAAQRCGHCGARLLATDTVHYPDRRGETDSGNPLLGTVVDGKYRLQAVLGRGGLGTVFQAVHIGSLMRVAVKLLHPRFAERAEYRRALLPEARRAATVTHVRCARLLDVGEADDGAAYLAMELIEGDTLEVLVRNGRFPPSHAVDVLLQIAEALEAIHAAGLVHCDLSPRNVMVSVRNRALEVKVLDFGIARSVTIAAGDGLAKGELRGFGNPVFSAPEVLTGKDVDQRADLYSFGTLAWLLLTGQPPVDDSDPRRASLAIAAGELQPWPGVPGVPRRLLRLVQGCLAREPGERPASIADVRAELQLVRGVRRPVVQRVALVAAAVAAVVAVAPTMLVDQTPPFLQVWASALVLSERAPTPAEPVQELSSKRLATLGFHFGGFAPDRLRIDVARNGMHLLGAPLGPEADVAAGTLTLSTAQKPWRDLLVNLRECSDEGPLDVSFVVPGMAPLGSARLRLDDEPPHVEAHLDPGQEVVTGATRLHWSAADNVGIAAAWLDLAWGDGATLTLPLAGKAGTFELGAAIAAARPSVVPFGPGQLTLNARDLAGNEQVGAAVRFAGSDVAAPRIVEVSGPLGEPFVPCQGGTARLRVRANEAEPGCRVVLSAADGVQVADLTLAEAGGWQVVEVEMAPPRDAMAAVPIEFVVVDPAGNRTLQEFRLSFRDRSLRLQFGGDDPGMRQIGRELVVASDGAVVTATCGEPYTIVQARLEAIGASAPVAATSQLSWQALPERGAVRIAFGAEPPGAYELQLQLQEGAADGGHRVPQRVPVRVLPPVIEVAVPAARSRFLPGVIDAGLLQRRGKQLVEGSGWRVPPDLAPYLRGTLWIGDRQLVPRPLPARDTPDGALLPAIEPVAGHNVLALDLRDVLDRPVRVVVGDRPAPQRDHEGRTLAVVADFWWHDALVETVGEELLVEYGQPALLRVRVPLPFTAVDANELLLDIASDEVAAANVTASEGDATVLTFELKSALWSVAAQLADRSREEYAKGIERTVKCSLMTPAGRSQLELHLRTTRSTLQPVTLADIGDVPPALAGIRLVPVLGPTGPFAEPVPTEAPPRALFRPQVAVAVRNIPDLLLQDRELCCGQARALLDQLPRARALNEVREFVHADDPLQAARLLPGNLLPVKALSAASDQPLTGIDFYQAYTLCRLLGFAVGDNPQLFRLPLGCELELAAFAGAQRPACNGVAAHGKGVAMAAFMAAAQALQRGRVATAAELLAAGDVVPSGMATPFLGLDFGVREWVFDLPHIGGAPELLLREWLSDHQAHLVRAIAMAHGVSPVDPDPVGAMHALGVVRGLAFGELEGLIDATGARIDPATVTTVPAIVPGVLRTEQLLRTGRDLLSQQPDPRLAVIGCRVVGTPVLQAFLRGRR